MKKNLVRAALVAGLSMFVVGTTYVATPAVAADKADKPTISKSVSKQLSDAQKALVAKDWATAVAKCKEAQGVADLSDFDKYIINRFLGMAYLNLNDHANATISLVAAAQSPAVPADERNGVMRAAIGLENEAGDYAKVIALGQLADQQNALDDTTTMIVGAAYFQTNDYPNAVKFAQRSVDLATAAGKVPDRRAYQIVVLVENRQKDVPGETKTFEILSTNYGNVDDWAHLIDLTLATLNTSNKIFREIAALDIYRLRLTTGATSLSDDYLAMADAATIIRSPGDAQQSLHEGVSKGILGAGKAAAMLNKANADAARDRPVLPQAEAAAAKSPSSNEDLSVGEAYFGYGQYADASRVAQRAIGKGGPKIAEAKLLLGMSQAKLGDNANAAQTLLNVDGDPSIARAAHLWWLYATRKYGLTPAATAPAQ